MKLAFLILVAAINPVPAGDLVQTNELGLPGVFSFALPAATNHPAGMFPGLCSSNLDVFGWRGTNSPVPDFAAGNVSLNATLLLVATNPPGLTFNLGQPSAKGKPPVSPLRACLKPGVTRLHPIPSWCLSRVLILMMSLPLVRDPTGRKRCLSSNRD